MKIGDLVQYDGIWDYNDLDATPVGIVVYFDEDDGPVVSFFANNWFGATAFYSGDIKVISAGR